MLESDPAALAQLREALVIDEASLAEQHAFMTLGELYFHFFRGHDLRTIVTYLIPPPWVRWDGWQFDARLREPDRLAKWLTDRGWSGRGPEFTPITSR